ncbi:MAG TPA: response regulator [Gemmataceae bacterium]|nr:response regulator [Gemmataceae bacterium]
MPETIHPSTISLDGASDTKVNVLLVDDQPANLLSLEVILQDLGLNLVKVLSGEQALRRLLMEDFAVVLLDVQMHGLDGFETAKLIRGREKSRHTPIIFLTAYEDNRLPVEEAYALGAVDYLVKPLVPVILKAKVAGFVELFLKTEQVRRQAEQLRQMEHREFERRLAEENARLQEQQKALQESEQRFRQLAESINEVFWMIDVQTGQTLYISPAYEVVWGRPRQNVYQQPHVFLEAVHPADRDRVLAAVERQRRGDAAAEEYRIVRPDGSIRWIRDRAFPIPDELGRVHRVAGVAEDITEQRRAEKALRDSEQRLNAIIDNSPAIIFLKDTEGRYLLINRAFEKYCGLDRKKIEGWRDHDLFPKEMADAFAANDQQVLREGTARQYEELVILGGSTHALITIKFPLVDAAGIPTAICGIATDITDRKQAEDALREADRRKDEFLAMLAHELRNPLAPIRNAVQIMRMVGATDPELQRTRDMIDRQVEHMTRLVDDLLEVSRITGGKIKLQKETVDLVAVANRAVETSRPLIDARQHELIIDFPPRPIVLEADPTRLAQIISNLLNNAAKYTENGGQIWLMVGQEGSLAEVRVRDNGIGMPADLLPKVFDLFTQADRSLDRSQGGLGIGLTLVKSLVTLHGGQVTAHSGGPGQGSEFVVQLPVSANATEDRNRADRDNVQRPITVAACRRILVVDDNKDSAESIAMLLRFWGHDVRTALDGRTALETAQAYRPEAVLLDIGLPNVNGYDVARQLRQVFGRDHLFLVAITGYGRSEDRQRSAEAGFDRHLVKPVNPMDLEVLFGPGGEGMKDEG